MLFLLLLSCLFLVSAVSKIGGLPSSLRHRERMAVPLWLWRLTGWAQIAGVLGLLAALFERSLQVVAGAWLALIMLGAGIAHLRVRDAWQHYVTVIALLSMSLATIFLA